MQYSLMPVWGRRHSCLAKAGMRLQKIPLKAGAAILRSLLLNFTSKGKFSSSFYQVYLENYKTTVSLTSTLRCGYHKYDFENKDWPADRI